MKEKIDLLLKEFQEVKLRLDKLKNNLNRKPKIIVGLVGTIRMRGGMGVPISTGITMMTSHVGPR